MQLEKGEPAGPPLALLAGISLGLLVAAVVSSAALGGVFPSPFSDAAAIERYFAEEPDAVLAGAVFGLASAVPLMIYAGAAAARVHTPARQPATARTTKPIPSGTSSSMQNSASDRGTTWLRR